jgi:hypothetical protein
MSGFEDFFDEQPEPSPRDWQIDAAKKRLLSDYFAVGIGLPVLCIAELPDTTLKRFESWHERQVLRQRKR